VNSYLKYSIIYAKSPKCDATKTYGNYCLINGTLDMKNDLNHFMGKALRGRMEQANTFSSTKLQLLYLWLQGRHYIANWDKCSKKTIKLASITLRDKIKSLMNPHCLHLKGRGGVKGGIRWLSHNLDKFTFVARFDVKSYYNSIQHKPLLAILNDLGVADEVFQVVKQYLEISDIWNYGQGMVAGGALSPILGALYLLPLDMAMQKVAKSGKIFYLRYQDDVIILAKDRRSFRETIKTMYKIIEPLGLQMHTEEKRFIGRIGGGFDFLGYEFFLNRKLRPSKTSLERFLTKARQLYEQGANYFRIWEYTGHWTQYLWGGLGCLVTRKGGIKKYFVMAIKKLRITNADIKQLYDC